MRAAAGALLAAGLLPLCCEGRGRSLRCAFFLPRARDRWQTNVFRAHARSRGCLYAAHTVLSRQSSLLFEMWAPHQRALPGSQGPTRSVTVSNVPGAKQGVRRRPAREPEHDADARHIPSPVAGRCDAAAVHELSDAPMARK